MKDSSLGSRLCSKVMLGVKTPSRKCRKEACWIDTHSFDWDAQILHVEDGVLDAGTGAARSEYRAWYLDEGGSLLHRDSVYDDRDCCYQTL